MVTSNMLVLARKYRLIFAREQFLFREANRSIFVHFPRPLFLGISKKSMQNSDSDQNTTSTTSAPGPAWLTSARLVGHALTAFSDIHETLSKVSSERGSSSGKGRCFHLYILTDVN